MYLPLPRSFYDRDPSYVAPDLLGKLLVTSYNQKLLVGVIDEVEAYLPFDDPASHGCKGRTATRESLFSQGGNAYVYGMRQHFLFNAVTEREAYPGAVLVRGVLPLVGVETMLQLRNKKVTKNLTDGPGKVCQAFAISKAYDGIDLTDASSPVYIAYSEVEITPDNILRTPRIGISKAVDKLLRFNLKDVPLV